MKEEIEGKLGKLWNWSRESENDYWITRFLVLRALGFTYFFAFLSLVLQLKPLLGSDGLTPVKSFMPEYSSLAQFFELPTLFWFSQSDTFMMALALMGLAISFLVLIGFANVPMLFYNWLVYLSFVNAGQIWFSYGWEIQLVETGFLAMFLVPALDLRPFSKGYPPPKLIIWMFRWLAVRVYLGSGLIKLKGVECWQNLTCLERFFQTQPIPNPVSPWMHQLPSFFKKFGVLYTHVVQLLGPFTAIFEKRNRELRNWGGVLMLSMQLVLIIVGNFAFLNWVTIVAALAFFDDRFLKRFIPGSLLNMLEEVRTAETQVSDVRHGINLILVLFVIAMSVPVVVNLVSPAQAMNSSFNNWNFVNTYGAFGSVREERTEVVIEGTTSENLSDAEWREYDFPHKPDKENEVVTQVAPYQPRIAWQMWFASFSRPEREPWLLHLSYKLMRNDPEALKLVKKNPFSEQPPEYIRAKLYRFEMQPPLEEKTWEREELGIWMDPISRDDPRLENFVESNYS